jgi:hypothetical protein
VRLDGNVAIGVDAEASSILHVDTDDANTTPILTLANTNGDFQIFRGDATPESLITASIGDIVSDSTNGVAYIKNSGNGTNTGWLSFANNGLVPFPERSRLTVALPSMTVRTPLAGTPLAVQLTWLLTFLPILAIAERTLQLPVGLPWTIFLLLMTIWMSY